MVTSQGRLSPAMDKKKHPKSPPTEEWIKMWHIYTVEYSLTIKKTEIIPFAAIWMDLEIVILSQTNFI